MGITRVLVANRGEIARRVFATCRRLGIGTVAVYTDPDAAAPHVAEADARVRLHKTNDYLNAEAIIAAARAAGADAVHPGYGFLSENAEFAAAVQHAGLTWVGPPVDAVRAMGSKIESKKLMAAAGVPVLEELDPETVTQAQLPVLVKASAGGGGRGMRVVRRIVRSGSRSRGRTARSAVRVRRPDRVLRALPADRAPHRGSGDGGYSRHRVGGRASGNAPSSAATRRSSRRRRRHWSSAHPECATSCSRPPGWPPARSATPAPARWSSSPTESQAGDFYFLEMNTRLQVEHPVTEETTGLDLVDLQLDVADGGRLGAEPPAAQGHSIEARLYAEDPAHGWQPQAGAVHRIDVPSVRTQFSSLDQRTGIRLDSGIVDGSVVSIHYDPMLAKVISYAPTRRQSALVLADALARAHCTACAPTANCW